MFRITDDDITMIIEEIAIDGCVALGCCSRSTAYRTVKRINYVLERDNYEWRVKLIIDNAQHIPYELKAINVGE